EEYPEGFKGAATSDELKRTLAAIAGFLATARADRARRIDDQLGARLPPPSRWAVRIGDATHQVALAQDEVRVDGEVVDLAME
ncbi:hypothetical protein ABTN45_20240, partial [Acinetobacter baumannii]